MAGKAYAGETTNHFSPRAQKAYCDGMAYRLEGTAAARPISGNPFDNTSTEEDAEAAWDAGWTFADTDSPGALSKSNCNLEGTVAA